jgi:hypothetical protein
MRVAPAHTTQAVFFGDTLQQLYSEAFSKIKIPKISADHDNRERSKT